MGICAPSSITGLVVLSKTSTMCKMKLPFDIRQHISYLEDNVEALRVWMAQTAFGLCDHAQTLGRH